MELDDLRERESSSWIWIAAAVGAAVGVIGVVSLLRRRNPVRRMNRILRRCEDRIHSLETSLAEIESSLQPS